LPKASEGAVAAALALLLGAWLLMMQARLEMLPAGLAEADRVMLKDTIPARASGSLRPPSPPRGEGLWQYSTRDPSPHILLSAHCRAVSEQG